jgi:hypothetical protein
VPCQPFFIVFKMSKWGITRIDRFRRSFLWKGSDPENVKGGHCLVNWLTCTRPKRLGGLGIKDLEKFGRALRLRWLWFNWDHQERPWKHLLKVTDHVDRLLFFSSTTISVGNGKCTPFWEARWLQGMAPKELAPSLFQVTRFKNRTVHAELHNQSWIRNLKSIDSATQVEEFVLLFMSLADVELND